MACSMLQRLLVRPRSKWYSFDATPVVWLQAQCDKQRWFQPPGCQQLWRDDWQR